LGGSNIASDLGWSIPVPETLILRAVRGSGEAGQEPKPNLMEIIKMLTTNIVYM
jgi:hypothetical protein